MRPWRPNEAESRAIEAKVGRGGRDKAVEVVRAKRGRKGQTWPLRLN